MPRYHDPNPLDLLFFAADDASRRRGLPEAVIQLALELDGPLDVARFRRAVAVVQRAYPVLSAPCEMSARTGRPRWRLDPECRSATEAVHVHAARPSVDASVPRILEELFARRRNDRAAPPVEFHVVRGCVRGDVVLMRWPHALMDARGGYTILEEVDRLSHEGAVPAELESAQGESRDDYAERLLPQSLRQRVRAALRAVARPAGPVPRYAHLVTEPIPVDLGRLRCVVRHLSPDQTARAWARAAQLCGTAGFGHYLRACGLRALHETMPRPVPGAALYTTLNVIDNRKRQQHRPVCCNLTSSLPLVIPAAVVTDRQRVAQALQRQMRAHVRSRTMSQIASLLWLLTRLPTAWVAAAVSANLRPGRRITPRLGALPAPSLPLGLMTPFARAMPTFCGVGLRNYCGCRPAVPDTGFAIDANLTSDRLNLIGVCYEKRVAVQTLAVLLDRFVAALLE